MLPDPSPSGLRNTIRQHRRQNSTPAAYEFRIAPNTNALHRQPRPVSHRRGMSLDTRRQMQPHNMMVSTPTNNTGSANTPQHVVREAQQQRIARPGPQQAYANLASDESYLVSPQATPNLSSFDPQSIEGFPISDDGHLSFEMYNQQQLNALVNKNQSEFSNPVATSDFSLYSPTSLNPNPFMNFAEHPTVGTPGWVSENEATSSRRNSRRISNGIMDRVNKYEHMGLDPAQRPLTPPKQNELEYFPLSPLDTPHGRPMKHVKPPQRFADGYDESTEETVRPTRQSANRRPQTTFDDMRQATDAQHGGTEVRRSNTLPIAGIFNPASTPAQDFLAMGPSQSASLSINTNCDGMPRTSYPMSASSSFSQHLSPLTPNFGDLSGEFDLKPVLGSQDPLGDMFSDEPMSMDRTVRGHSHRRTESAASLASAASIASIDIEKTKTTTGITSDDIQQYIQGPDPRDSKYTCIFEDCNKRFGRKENIKSHVQTHLNDRQYKCPSCHKCFVRQHDLKRHAKIHTGIKPYPCECGNSFARHDALTRHRQRGMCVGAFDGIVKKTVKRGRPRKPRPDNEERREKATRTRRKNKSVSSVSSQSGYSDCSSANSPENGGVDIEMFDDIMDISLGGTTMNPSSLQSATTASTAPMPTLAVDPPISVHSPTNSVHSYVSQLSHMSLHPGAVASDVVTTQANTPARSVASPAAELPDLSHESSPPYYDTEQNSSGLDLMISSAANASAIPAMVDMSATDSEVMLMFGSETKFDESYDGADLFTGNDSDLFFGTS
ncbi:hypothetical protein F5Y16DRAFT_269216 [Xylariaceae sp. FL0255]|nr:hypothetical protein F5Y16DRAFT_269216 [Xylariaceae sp. FL0255]